MFDLGVVANMIVVQPPPVGHVSYVPVLSKAQPFNDVVIGDQTELLKRGGRDSRSR